MLFLEVKRVKIFKERLEKVKANVISAVLNKYIEKMVRMGTIAIIMNKVMEAGFLKRKRRNAKNLCTKIGENFSAPNKFNIMKI
ncbi:hypothetical protein [Paraclostridium sp. AKS81]|uniref:hypothetical protein n=1 Tax=Paraclostridium sp. AKS81 TaxID=2876117 RepID=UPI0021DF9469|nr:hypothetical protein [Paraclostridium sp. AKS81]MCU9810324.1 hypothetical protein [Paraclostridium sp. AKS81]